MYEEQKPKIILDRYIIILSNNKICIKTDNVEALAYIEHDYPFYHEYF